MTSFTLKKYIYTHIRGVDILLLDEVVRDPTAARLLLPSPLFQAEGSRKGRLWRNPAQPFLQLSAQRLVTWSNLAARKAEEFIFECSDGMPS